MSIQGLILTREKAEVRRSHFKAWVFIQYNNITLRLNVVTDIIIFHNNGLTYFVAFFGTPTLVRYSVKISVIMMFFCSGKFAETLMTNNQKLGNI